MVLLLSTTALGKSGLNVGRFAAEHIGRLTAVTAVAPKLYGRLVKVAGTPRSEPAEKTRSSLG